MAHQLPPQTRIGHVHLKVSSLDKALAFYRDLLGFEVMQYYGTQAAFLSAGGYHHHIGLNTWYSRGAGPAPQNSCGLFHTAILLPTR
ncbi:MAG TPA: VOC family protein, partial [Chitinophagaceae bacterium]|nr:VOC family protein [Chitinophagaceae bacterium]